MGEFERGRSLAETPTWAFATVVSIMVALGFFFHASLKQFGKWSGKTKRMAFLAGLEKIKEELVLFGLLSLLMGHWITFVAKIYVKSSTLSGQFFPCLQTDMRNPVYQSQLTILSSNYLNYSVFHEQLNNMQSNFCLEIYSWKTWENQAKSMALQELQVAKGFVEGSPQAASDSIRMRRLSTFIFHQTSHPWSQHKVLVWLLCFSRQFWSSINRADYMALRLGFISTHQLPFTYDFHNYMLRSMEEEFRDIVGISVPLWIFAILCIFLAFHGTNLYLWLSFLPPILILAIGTKLHLIVVKLAVEIMDRCPVSEAQHFNLRDDLFWFRRPRLLLWLLQFVSFQNAFEMAMFVWSLWETQGSSCFIEKRSFIVIRLTFGLASQFWCSFTTFPLYVIVTQMASKFKKSIVSRNVRTGLHRWKRRAGHGVPSLTVPQASISTVSLDSAAEVVETVGSDSAPSSSTEGGSSRGKDDTWVSVQNASALLQDETCEILPSSTLRTSAQQHPLQLT